MSNKSEIFVLMPFDKEFNDLYEFIKVVFEKNQLYKVFRADDLKNQQSILKDIVISINNCDLILADLTGFNPNVLYELGIAHGFNKNVILITQDIDEIPFDLRSYRVVQYSIHFSKIKEFERDLNNIIEELNTGNIKFGNPVSDYISIDEIEKKSEKRQLSNNEKELIIENDKEHKEEELSMLDDLEVVQNALPELTNIVNKFNDQTGIMNRDISKYTKQIQNVMNDQSSGTYSHLRKLYKKVSNVLEKFSTYVSECNTKYNTVWTEFERSTTNLLMNDIMYTSDEAKENLKAFIDKLVNIKSSMEIGNKSVSTIAEEVAKLKGFEKSINRSTDLVQREVNTFAGLIAKSISSIDRIQELSRKYF